MAVIPSVDFYRNKPQTTVLPNCDYVTNDWPCVFRVYEITIVAQTSSVNNVRLNGGSLGVSWSGVRDYDLSYTTLSYSAHDANIRHFETLDSSPFFVLFHISASNISIDVLKTVYGTIEKGNM